MNLSRRYLSFTKATEENAFHFNVYEDLKICQRGSGVCRYARVRILRHFQAFEEGWQLFVLIKVALRTVTLAIFFNYLDRKFAF